MKFTEINLLGGSSNIRYDKSKKTLVYSKEGEKFSLVNLKNIEVTNETPQLNCGYSYVIVGSGNFFLPRNPVEGDYLRVFAKEQEAVVKTYNYTVEGDTDGIEIDANSGCGFCFNGTEWKIDEIKVNQVSGYTIGDSKQEFTEFEQDTKWGRVTVLNSTKEAMVASYQYRAVTKVVLYMTAEMSGEATLSLNIDGVEEKEISVNALSTIFTVEFEVDKKIGLFSFKVKQPLVNSGTEQDLKIIGAEFYY